MGPGARRGGAAAHAEEASAATWAEAPTSDVPAAGAATACTGTSDTATSRSDADAHARAIRWRASERHAQEPGSILPRTDSGTSDTVTAQEPPPRRSATGIGAPLANPTASPITPNEAAAITANLRSADRESTASALASTIVRRPGARARGVAAAPRDRDAPPRGSQTSPQMLPATNATTAGIEAPVAAVRPTVPVITAIAQVAAEHPSAAADRIGERGRARCRAIPRPPPRRRPRRRARARARPSQ